jgi:hypothetical protein
MSATNERVPPPRRANHEAQACFARAIADVCNDPSAVNVIRYLRASKALGTGAAPGGRGTFHIESG